METTKEDILCAIIAARIYMEAQGWEQRTETFGRDCGPACAAGAINSAILLNRGFSDEKNATYTDACSAICESIGIRQSPLSLGCWNDKKGRTKAQVLKAFDETIVRLEKELGR